MHRHLRLIHAHTPDHYARAAAFRHCVYRTRRHLTLTDDVESDRDHRGHLFLLTDDARLVATARTQPFPDAQSSMLEHAPGLPGDLADSEVNRVATLESPHTVRYSLAILGLGALWLVHHTHHIRYVAHCHPRLLPTYQLIGATPTRHHCRLPHQETPHAIIAGTYHAAATSALGILDLTANDALHLFELAEVG